MAFELVRRSQIWLQRAKTLVGPALGVVADAGTHAFDNRVATADIVTWQSGTGAPTHTAPDGSMYTRIDAANADEFHYGRIGGAWVASVAT